MEFLSVAKLIALFSLVFSASAILYRFFRILKYPQPIDYATPKSSSLMGVAYAFTFGMAPWAKESTRKHWVLYLRGILFHLGIFSALLFFVLRLLSFSIPQLTLFLLILTGIGAIMGIVGMVLRFGEKNLRMISNFDDHLSLWLVTIFLLLMVLSHFVLSTLPIMFLFTSIMFIYIPFSKIRHFIYFFFSRLFFGNHLGKRGIIKKLEIIHGK
jgi:hypothetical protein